ncbi:hypothetical protein AG1IA_10309 [Rhizoctonia solani AG-1 IA]|uniref:Uncharacterized protein n=1 Tax=Thanatephorus cucumeris (strain AG1-IA) TaxID=983506 RepID=L8WBV4_THACA|nr:hypothetical protein AG1IA_10309 [Rhizoctonia solani AG-1 IA]
MGGIYKEARGGERVGLKKGMMTKRSRALSRPRRPSWSSVARMPTPTPDYFHPFSSGDRPQPAPLLPSSPHAVLLYLGAGLDLYPVASHYAGFSTFLYVDAKPRLTRRGASSIGR